MIDWLTDLMPLADSAGGAMGSLTTFLYEVLGWTQVALGIGLVIFVHELGHFVAAKTFGVKCEKFYVGFDVPISIGPIKFPRTLGKFRYGETEYGIGIIPLGGYVKMLGQDDDPRKQESEAQRIKIEGEEAEQGGPPKLDPRSFPAKPVWQRMIIISAGVVVNVITGVLFAAIAFGFGVKYNPAVVGGVTPGGPAWQAGIEPGGKVVAVGTWSDPEMHFREMQTEILTKGLEYPDQPINVNIQYDDRLDKFDLSTQADPRFRDRRMIGLAPPFSARLGSQTAAIAETTAAAVLTSEDAEADVISYDSVPINREAIVPVTPLLNHLNTHPDKPVTLRLRRTDGTERDVTIQPQSAKSLGARFVVGPVVALIDGGPAKRAGLQVGDVIRKVNDDDSIDAYGLAQQLVGMVDPVRLVVQRGEGDAAEMVDITITPNHSPQTLPPTASISGEIAVNSVGFAYQPLPVVTSLLRPAATESAADSSEESTSLQPGDTIKWVALDAEKAKDLAGEDDEFFAAQLQQLVDRWEISDDMPLNDLRELIQLLPVGTPLTVALARPVEPTDGGQAGTARETVMTTKLTVVSDDIMMYDRGLVLGQQESLQQAASVSEAMSLGLREGYRRFTDVIRFLKMLPRGRIKLRHVGGPLEIVNIAKHETDKGISEQLLFLTLLSMNLAILNFLPIPALDGGHMVFLTYELVAGKRANEQLEFRLTVAGLLTLLMLMVVVFANDIIRHL